jgi:hypothetical protein
MNDHPFLPSFRRKPESSDSQGHFWIPAFAGMTAVLLGVIVLISVDDCAAQVRGTNTTVRWKSATGTNNGGKEGPVSQKEDSIALSLVYDTSSSMVGKVERGNAALTTIIEHLDAYVKYAPGKRKLDTGLVVFTGLSGGIYATQGNASRIKFAAHFGHFDAKKLLDWVSRFNQPSGATPLGKAVEEAAKPLLSSSLDRKQMLIITDGGNNTGDEPSVIIQKLRRQGSRARIEYYCVKVESPEVSNPTLDSLQSSGVKIVHDLNKNEMETMLRDMTKTN